MTKLQKGIPFLLLSLCLILSSCGSLSADTTEGVFPSPTESVSILPEHTEASEEPSEEPSATPNTVATLIIDDIPDYSGDPYIAVNDNVPYFTEDELTTSSFETYSSLDILGRCGVAFACVGTDLMPTEERGSIGQIKPTGWHTVTYEIVDGRYLYNRCHLIGYQLSGENANEQNLITGTRYMNVDGMLPFENMVADYVKESGNHVMYRVTPLYDGDNLLASGVQMEAMSVEDNGDGVLFNVYVYNVQPGIIIDYATGDSWLEDDSTVTETEHPQQELQPATSEPSNVTIYILNTNTMKFHYPSCSSVSQMSDNNKVEFSGTRDDVIAMGYDPCGRCNP